MKTFILVILGFLSSIIYLLQPAYPQTKEVANKDYRLAVVDSLNKIFKFKSKIPLTDAVKLYSAKNEYESFQILIDEVKKDLSNVMVNVSDLTNLDEKATIPRSSIKVRLVGYVPTKKPYYKTSFVGLWPDPLIEQDRFDIKKGDTQALWVTVYVPENTPAGEYKGVIEVNPENAPSQGIPLNIHIWNFKLPKESHLKTAFDFYENEITKFNTRKRQETYADWQKRIREISEAYYLSMLQYRISPILNLDPLSSDFNARITKYLDYGISAFGIGKYGGTFGNNWPEDNPGSLIPLYKRYAQVLREKNILDKAYIYTWDEGNIGNPRVKEVTEIIHKADPELKNMVCYQGFWDPDKDPEWGKDIDIWCFQIANYNERLKKKLEEAGKEIWMYISGPDSTHPNFAIDFPAIDARIIPWMCWKHGIKGLLYWAVNFSRVNPYEDAMNTDWQQNGNGLLYYPGENGPVPSLRLELIRDGLEDYEYLYLLQELYEQSRVQHMDTAAKEEIERLLSLKHFVMSLSDYNRDPQALYDMRKRIAEKIIFLKRINAKAI